MDEAILKLINSTELDLPGCPAVYAIFSNYKCRFVGVTDNLHETIVEHFKPTEPNIPLRYFMQSVKPKILQYEELPNSSINDRIKMKERWILLYNPSDNKSSAPQLELIGEIVTIGKND